MKKQIETLMKQAGTDTSGKWMGVEHAEKFAELIVKECAQKLENDGMVEVAIEIKQHFGVE
jgi:hypothetical protein